MFLKLQGVTGEASDSAHKGEIELVSWAWGMEAPTSLASGVGKAGASVSELRITKRVDLSSPTLMGFLRNRKKVSKAQLTVRKSGDTPFEYLKIELDEVLVTSFQTNGAMGSSQAEVLENICLGFSHVRVTYSQQGMTGGPGGGANVFEADAQTGAS